MFQFKNLGSGSDSENPSLENKLPNFHGKVRTFKEDAENFEKGIPSQSSAGEETSSYPLAPAEKNISPRQQPLVNEEPSQPQPTYQKNDNPVKNPFQSMPTPPPISSSEPSLSALQSSSSQSFFSEKPSSSENILPPQPKTQPSPQKPKKVIFVSLIILFVAIIFAAGFYYWFYIKDTASETPAAPVAEESTLPETQSAPVVQPETEIPQNNDLRKLIVDMSKKPTDIKDASTKFTSDFVATAAEGDLIEVKVFDQTNQPIGKKDFFAGLGITVPDAVAMKLSEDYSLFVKKELGVAKLGLVFKTVTSANLADEMKNWEPKITADLASVYINQILSPATGPFNSTKYKNADIRYFNFSSPPNTSLDYSVIANFLVIGTSKDTTRGILDYMSQK